MDNHGHHRGHEVVTHLKTLPTDSTSTRIFVGIPRIAQSRVDASELTIQGIALSQTQAGNFTLSINSTLRADSPVGAAFDPFDAVMYLEDWAPQTPYARVRFPRTTSAAETVVNITQFTEVLDQDAFAVFNTWFLLNETLNLSVEGDTHVKVSGISRKFPVHFKKTINMPGLSNLNGTTVPESSISLTADAQGDNFFGTVTIPNRSLIGFEMVSRALLHLTRVVSEDWLFSFLVMSLGHSHPTGCIAPEAIRLTPSFPL